jgi:hypothetical protein
LTDKIKAWWSDDGPWFSILVDDGVCQATVSLTPDEAIALAKKADPKQYEVVVLRNRPHNPFGG